MVWIYLLIKKRVRIKRATIAFVISFILGVIAIFGIVSLRALQIRQALVTGNVFYTNKLTCEANTGKECYPKDYYWLPGNSRLTPKAVPALPVDKNGPWIEYSDSIRGFQVGHPSNWYVLNYVEDPCITMSDLPQPYDVPTKIPVDNHEFIRICNLDEVLPTTFAYTNGSDNNPTIQPYSTNGYSGIRGLSTSAAGLSDVVYLTDPNGGVIQITHFFGKKDLFNNFLSTLQTIKPQIDTTNWKTYTNQSYGFSLRYPNNWGELNSPEATSDGLLTILTKDLDPHGSGRKSGIYITVTPNKNKQSLEDYIKTVIIPQQQGCGDVEILKDKSQIFKGINAVVTIGYCGAGAPGPVAYISSGNNIIELFSDGLIGNETYQIFSTFKTTN
ncbi:MAG TPA: hypothetical protein VG917_01945 [Patescibacteria group bacterium]|nr:hypothetical protein [Patescibacteria group bacterium]